MVIEPTRIKLSDLSGLLGMEELVRLAIATEWLIVEAPTIVTVRQDGSRLDETKPLRDCCPRIRCGKVGSFPIRHC